MEKVEIESFTLDHTKVKAPYVRLISEEKGPNGDIVSNFDVRLCQPNRQEIPTGVMHTLEHLFALYLRPRITGYLDCSPFGCRTGFHLLAWENIQQRCCDCRKRSFRANPQLQNGKMFRVQKKKSVVTTKIILYLVLRNGQKKF